MRTPATAWLKERFDLVDDFHEGLAKVVKDGKIFHIRHDGTRAD